jgi:HEAT repeat protein
MRVKYLILILASLIAYLLGSIDALPKRNGLIFAHTKPNILLLHMDKDSQSKFISVTGETLATRLQNAAKMAAAHSSLSPYWTAYAFDVRPRVTIDLEYTLTNTEPVAETGNLALFLLHTPENNNITRIEVYNLMRQREYSRYPVYWLARAGNQESLDLLQPLVANAQDRLPEQAVLAIALHDDVKVADLLQTFAQPSNDNSVRKTAIFWLGQIGGKESFLAALVGNGEETMPIRQKAAFAIGASKSKTAFNLLEQLYRASKDNALKNSLISAIGINRDKEAVTTFLIGVAREEKELRVKKNAIFWLGQQAGERVLVTLRNMVDSIDTEAELQKQAVDAISRQPKEVAIPLLIKIAQTHAKTTIRKQALLCLGRSGDERAVELFQDILSK